MLLDKNKCQHNSQALPLPAVIARKVDAHVCLRYARCNDVLNVGLFLSSVVNNNSGFQVLVNMAIVVSAPLHTSYSYNHLCADIGNT